MPFDLRCPSCQAKLRLDEAPAPRSSVECPKCGESFAAPARPVVPKPEEPKKDESHKKKSTEDTKAATGEKVVSKDRVHMNEFALLGIVGGSVLVLGLILYGITWYLGKAAKVEDLLAMLPKNTTSVRGVNYAQLMKYPGYKMVPEKHFTGNVRAAYEDLDKAMGGSGPEKNLNYFFLARESTDNGDGLSMLFNTKKPFDASSMATALKATTGNQNGTPYYRLPASNNPLLNYAILYTPNTSTVVVIVEGPGARAAQPSQYALARLDQSISYKTDKAEVRFSGDLGTAGRLAIRGHSFEVIRPVGPMKTHAQFTTALARNGPPGNDTSKGPAQDPNSKAGVVGWWVSVGGRGVRMGIAVELDSTEAASNTVRKYQEGPLGKGDESEVPNGTKAMIQESAQKEFMEFLQNLAFRSKGPAAYLTSKMETGPEKARPLIDLFLKSFGGNPFNPSSGGFGR